MNYTKKDLINICKIVGFGIILYWALQNLSLIGNILKSFGNVISPFIWGAAIAFVINIPMTIFERNIYISKKSKKKKRMKKEASKFERLLSILLSIVIIVLIIVGVVFLVIPELINVITNLIQYQLPDLYVYIKDLTNKAIIDYPQVSDGMKNLQSNLENINTEVIKELTTFATGLVTSSLVMISSVVSFIFKLIVAVIFAGYILMSKEKLLVQAKKILYAYFNEKTADKVCELASLSREAFYNFITGQFVECIILGSLCALGMLILRIPYSATVGTLVGITAFIPIVGAMIGAVVAVILILPISLSKAIIFVIFFIILQQTENNLIYPRVVGSKVGVPGILVLIAVAIGGNLGGAIGMIICLPITAIIYTLLRSGTYKRLKEKGITIEEGNEKK